MFSVRVSMALMLAAVMLGVLITGPARAAGQEPPVAPGEQKALLDPKSSMLGIIYEKYRNSGWAPEPAIAFAHRALQLPVPEVPLEAKPDKGAVLLDPRTSPLAIVYEMFRDSGWSPQEAMEIAEKALGIDARGSNCSAYKVRITYCSEGSKRQLIAFMNARCYEDPDGDPYTADGLQVCDQIMCLEGHRWLSLTVAATCGVLPDNGACVQMRVETPALSMDCTKIELDCPCFTETAGTVNCSAIEQCCCTSTVVGCTGCPSCTSPCPSP